MLLGPEQNVVVAISPYPPNRTGEIAEFQRYLPDGRLLLKSRDEEVVTDPAGTLAEVTLDCGQPVRWDKNLGLAFERVERSHGDGLFLEETPTDTFEQIGGLDLQIERVQRAIRLHMDHPDVTRLYNLDPLGAALLVGPPGTGKTMFARATANWLAELSPAGRSRFMYLKPSGLHTMWYGETERNYREAFRVAREAARRHPEVPVVVFIDEVDSVGSARGQSFTRADDRVLMAVMAELDGVERRGNVLVLAATNRADALDPALVRSGRLGDLVLDIPRPAREAARAILDKQLEGTPFAADDDRDPHATRHELIDAVIARIFAPNGSAPLAKLRLRDGQQREVTARDLVSGAAIANIAREASERACHRDVDSGARGVRLSDVLAAVDEELDKATRLLSPANCSRFLSGLPQDVDVVSVEPVRRHEARTHRFLKLA